MLVLCAVRIGRLGVALCGVLLVVGVSIRLGGVLGVGVVRHAIGVLEVSIE